MPLLEQRAEPRAAAGAHGAGRRAGVAPVPPPMAPAAGRARPTCCRSTRWTRSPTAPACSGSTPTPRRSAPCRRRWRRAGAGPRAARAKPVELVDEGPLVLVETRKDLSQFKLPFENQAPQRLSDAGLSPVRRRRLRQQRRRRSRFRAGARARAGRPAWCISSSQASGARLRQQVEAARFAVGIGLPVAVAPAAASRPSSSASTAAPPSSDWLHSSTRSQPASSASAAASA